MQANVLHGRLLFHLYNPWNAEHMLDIPALLKDLEALLVVKPCIVQNLVGLRVQGFSSVLTK